MQHNISQGHSECANSVGLAFFSGFLRFSPNAPKYRCLGGGMCILFEICERRPFQKCMG